MKVSLNSLMKEKLNLWVDYKVEKLKNLKNVSRKNSKAKDRNRECKS